MLVSDADISEIGHKILLFGPPKGGKTLEAGKLSQHYNLHWIDVENGWKTLKQLPIEWQKRISLYYIADNKTEFWAAKAAEALFRDKVLTICTNHHTVLSAHAKSCGMCTIEQKPQAIKTLDLSKLSNKTDVVVWDSFTQLSASTQAQSFGSSGMPAFKKMEYDNYNKQGFVLDSFGSLLQSSELNFVGISHEESLEMEDGKEKLVPKAGTRNFSRNFARYFDHCVYISVKNTKHTSSNLATNNAMALVGSRTPVNLEDPKSTGLVELMRSSKGSVEAAAAAAKIANATGQASTNVVELANMETDKKKDQEPKEVSNATADKLKALGIKM
jgi:hypothetical protein